MPTPIFCLQQPNIILFAQALTPQQCQAIITKSQPHLTTSTMIDDAGINPHVVDARRSSQTAQFPRNTEGDIAALLKIGCQLVSVADQHSEGIQITKYSEGQEYQPHYDFFDPNLPGAAGHLQHGGQRVYTVLLYLNDVVQGGETSFPLIGLAVKPKQGQALAFRNVDLKGNPDRATLHAGEPVVKGEKWIATLWFRENPF